MKTTSAYSKRRVRLGGNILSSPDPSDVDIKLTENSLESCLLQDSIHSVGNVDTRIRLPQKNTSIERAP